MTPKQLKTLKLICGHQVTRGKPPTFQQLGDTLGISRVSAFGLVGALEKQGVVQRLYFGKGKRSVVLTDEGFQRISRPMRFPIFGEVR